MAVEQAAGEFLAGGLGGLACVAAGQPLDTVKVKLQAFPGHYTSAYDCVRRTYRQGGLAAFYAGSSPAFVTNLIENAFLLVTYDSCLNAVKWLSGKTDHKQVPLFVHASAGSVASVPATLAYAPVDRIKSVMQVQRELSTGHLVGQRSQVHLLMAIAREEGIRGLFRGTSSLLYREFFGYFFFFLGYAGCRKLLNYDENAPSLWKAGLSGALAGCTFWGVMYPFDVVKSRIQVREELPGSFLRTVTEVVRHEVRTQGLRSLYRGLLLTLVRSFPANGALFITYEYTKSLLRRTPLTTTPL